LGAFAMKAATERGRRRMLQNVLGYVNSAAVDGAANSA